MQSNQIGNNNGNESLEKMNRRLAELSEKVKIQENIINQSNLMYADMVSANEQLQKEKESVFNDYLVEKKTNEGQIEQILRLNEEVIHSIEEKTQLENQIEVLQQEIEYLKKSLENPEDYYKLELDKVVDEKSTVDELYRLKGDEMKQLKTILADKIASIFFSNPSS